MSGKKRHQPTFRINYRQLIYIPAEPEFRLCPDCKGFVHRTVQDSHWCPVTTTGYQFTAR